jgi:uncharacterized coiled-coil protein SlyX
MGDFLDSFFDNDIKQEKEDVIEDDEESNQSFEIRKELDEINLAFQPQLNDNDQFSELKTLMKEINDKLSLLISHFQNLKESSSSNNTIEAIYSILQTFTSREIVHQISRDVSSDLDSIIQQNDLNEDF